MAQLSNRLQRLAPSATLAMSQKSAEMKAQGIDVINMSVGEPDFNTPDAIKEAAKRAVDENFSRYSPVPGYADLRTAIARKLERENHLHYQPSEILVSNGAKQSVCNTVMALVNDGEQFNIRRVVIPRKMTLRETKLMIDNLKDVKIEFEIMIIGYRCYFNDEDCHSVHSGSRRNLCGDVSLGQTFVTRRFPDNWKDVVQSIIDDPNGAFEEGSLLNEFRKHMAQPVPPPPRFDDDGPYCGGLDQELAKAVYQNCGLCAIKPFRDMGVHCLKVPLRGSSEFKLQSLKLVHKVMTHENPTPEYCRSLVNSPSFCDALTNCYYNVPEAHPNMK